MVHITESSVEQHWTHVIPPAHIDTDSHLPFEGSSLNLRSLQNLMRKSTLCSIHTSNWPVKWVLAPNMQVKENIRHQHFQTFLPLKTIINHKDTQVHMCACARACPGTHYLFLQIEDNRLIYQRNHDKLELYWVLCLHCSNHFWPSKNYFSFLLVPNYLIYFKNWDQPLENWPTVILSWDNRDQLDSLQATKTHSFMIYFFVDELHFICKLSSF